MAQVTQPHEDDYSVRYPFDPRPRRDPNAPITSAERMLDEENHVATNPNAPRRRLICLIITFVIFAGCVSSLVAAKIWLDRHGDVPYDYSAWVIYSAIFVFLATLLLAFACSSCMSTRRMFQRVRERQERRVRQWQSAHPNPIRNSGWSRWSVPVDRSVEQGAAELQEMHTQVNYDGGERLAGNDSRAGGEEDKPQRIMFWRANISGGSEYPSSNLRSPQISPVALDEPQPSAFFDRNLSPVVEESLRSSPGVEFQRSAPPAMSDHGVAPKTSPSRVFRAVSKFSAANIYCKAASNQDTKYQAASDPNLLSNIEFSRHNGKGVQVPPGDSLSARPSEGGASPKLTIVDRRRLRRLSVITLPAAIDVPDIEAGLGNSFETDNSSMSTKEADEGSGGNKMEGFEDVVPYSAT